MLRSTNCRHAEHTQCSRLILLSRTASLARCRRSATPRISGRKQSTVTTTPPALSVADFFGLPLGAVAAAAGDAIVLVDGGQTIVAINEAASQMFGYAQADLLGQPLSSLNIAPCAAQTRCPLSTIKRPGAQSSRRPACGHSL